MASMDRPSVSSLAYLHHTWQALPTSSQDKQIAEHEYADEHEHLVDSAAVFARFAVIKKSGWRHAIQNQQCSSCVLGPQHVQVPCYFQAPLSFISSMSETYSHSYHDTVLLRNMIRSFRQMPMSSSQIQPPSMHLSHVMRKAGEHVQTCFEQHVDLQGVPYRCSMTYHQSAVLFSLGAETHQGQDRCGQ